MIWALIIAGGIVALAFFLLMDVATMPARERAGSIGAAGYGKTRAVTRSSVLDDGTFRDRALVPMKTGLARAVLRITRGPASSRSRTSCIAPACTASSLRRAIWPRRFLCFLGFVGQVFASVAGVAGSKACCSGSWAPSSASCSRTRSSR